jgi:hypothetical protein
VHPNIALVGLAVAAAISQPPAAAPAASPCRSDSLTMQYPAHRFGESLTDVLPLNHDEMWAVGHDASGATNSVAEHYTRGRWQRVPTPADIHNGFLSALSGVNNSDIWAVGDRYNVAGGSNRTLAEHWDGRSWSIVSTPSPGRTDVGSDLNDVAAIAPDDVWAVGGYYVKTGTGAYRSRPLALHWDGRTWSTIAVATPSHAEAALHAVSAVSSTDVWAVGYAFTNRPVVVHWDGHAWHDMPMAAVGDIAGLEAVTVVGPKDIWAAGASYRNAGRMADRPLTEHWDGRGWKVVPAPDPRGDGEDEFMTGITAVRADDVWAVGGKWVQDTKQLARPFALHFDGNSWRVSPVLNWRWAQALFAVSATSAGNVVAVGYSDNGRAMAVGLRCPTTSG